MLEDKIEQLEHAKKCYLRDLEPERMAIVRKSFGLQVASKRRDWLKKQVKQCDEEIGGLREQERLNNRIQRRDTLVKEILSQSNQADDR